MATAEERESGPQVEDPDAIRAEWLRDLNALASQVKGWVEPAQWRTRLVSKPLRDEGLGRYEVPLLLMERDGVEVALNPVSRFVPGADGAVDLYVVPAYDEVASLYFKRGEWTLHYVFRTEGAAQVREAEAMALSERTLTRVLDAMAAHGEPDQSRPLPVNPDIIHIHIHLPVVSGQVDGPAASGGQVDHEEEGTLLADG
jgi:hypothetical protein